MLRKVISAFSVVSACAMLWGCANLEIYRLDNQGPNPPLTGKIPYYLPRASIIAAGAVTLEKCSLKKADDSVVGELVFSTKISPVSSTEPDYDFGYYIDYKSARGWMKEINFQIVTSPNKTLQSFNGQINDQAGPIGVGVLATAINVVAAATMPTIPKAKAPAVRVEKAVPEPVTIVQYCSEPVRIAIAKIKKQKDIIAEAQNATAAVPGPNFTKVQWEALLARQTQIIAAAQAEISQQNKALTRNVWYKWVPSQKDGWDMATADDTFRLTHQLDPSQFLSGWLTKDGMAWFNKPTQDEAWLKAHDDTLLYLAVDRRSVGDNSTNQTIEDSQRTLAKPGGLVIRDPAVGMLLVCKKSECPKSNEALAAVGKDYSFRTNVTLPQFGRILVLPEHSGLFENSSLTVELGADGTISKLGYRSSSTAAQGLATATTASGAAVSDITAHNSAVTAANAAQLGQAQYPGNVNKAIADCLMNQAAVIKAGGTPVPCQ